MFHINLENKDCQKSITLPLLYFLLPCDSKLLHCLSSAEAANEAHMSRLALLKHKTSLLSPSLARGLCFCVHTRARSLSLCPIFSLEHHTINRNMLCRTELQFEHQENPLPTAKSMPDSLCNESSLSKTVLRGGVK